MPRHSLFGFSVVKYIRVSNLEVRNDQNYDFLEPLAPLMTGYYD